MKKFFLSSFVIVTFLFYALHERIQSTEGSNVIAPAVGLAKNANGIYKNGQYTGDVTDAYYGNVQVKVIIGGGKITDVVFLDYPHDRRTSVMINTQAMPYLKTEAIQAQNANVDIVSGATATSQAFVQSLQSALAQAKN